MASFYPSNGYGNGNGNGNGDDTDRSLNRRTKKMGKSKFDGDGVLIEASAEREAANRRARIDNDWQIQRGRSTGRGRGRNEGNRTEDRNGKNLKLKHLKPNSGATNEAAAARGSNSLGDTAPPTAVAQSGAKTYRPMAGKNSEQGGSAPPAPDNSGNSQASQVMNHLSDTESAKPKSANPNFAAMKEEAAEAERLLNDPKAMDETNNAGPATVKAKIDAYLEEKKQRAAALAAEEEAAEAERLMDETETDNADITLTSSWADGDPPSPPSPPPAS
jgi:hypothetical protein